MHCGFAGRARGRATAASAASSCRAGGDDWAGGDDSAAPITQLLVLDGAAGQEKHPKTADDAITAMWHQYYGPNGQARASF